MLKRDHQRSRGGFVVRQRSQRAALVRRRCGIGQTLSLGLAAALVPDILIVALPFLPILLPILLPLLRGSSNLLGDHRSELLGEAVDALAVRHKLLGLGEQRVEALDDLVILKYELVRFEVLAQVLEPPFRDVQRREAEGDAAVERCAGVAARVEARAKLVDQAIGLPIPLDKGKHVRHDVTETLTIHAGISAQIGQDVRHEVVHGGGRFA